MEQVAKDKKYLHDGVPVIFFDADSQSWAPVDEGDKQSVVAAKYKNQLDEHERRKLNSPNAADGEDDLMAARRRRLLAEAEAEKKQRGRLPKGLSFFLLIAAVFYALWLFLQR
ncbi:MAG: hypothetical protein FWG53_01190 [Clostridiales bacterium]|nr:hypothetical protein [Clostridiales bacterium]